MNVESFLRLTNPKLLDVLRDFAQGENLELPSTTDKDAVFDSYQALLIFLQFARCAVVPFMDPKMPVQQRIHDAFVAYYFAAAWREDCLRRGDASTEFLSSNQYFCVRNNAKTLLLLVAWICSEEHLRQTVPFAPWVLGSLNNEVRFRLYRAGTARQINFSFAGGLPSDWLVQQAAVMRACSADTLIFPAHRKHKTLDAVHRSAEFLPPISTQELDTLLRNALQKARTMWESVGIHADSAITDVPDLDQLLDEYDALIDGVVADDLRHPGVDELRDMNPLGDDDDDGEDDDDPENSLPDPAEAVAAVGMHQQQQPQLNVLPEYEQCFWGLDNQEAAGAGATAATSRPAAVKMLDDDRKQIDKRLACSIVSGKVALSKDRNGRFKARGRNLGQM